MARTDAAGELAEKLVRTLQEQRQLGGAAYPLTLAKLASLADPGASQELVAKALGKKILATPDGPVCPMLAASKKHFDSPIGLAEDAERLAASPLLLQFALQQLCSTEKPLHRLDKVVGQVDKALRERFQAVLEQQVRDGTLPPAVSSISIKNKQHLYLKAFPPPLSPPDELARKLLETLRARREESLMGSPTEGGQSAYPVSLDEVKRLTDETIKAPLFKKALAQDFFRNQVLCPLPARTDAPVVLVEDRDLLVNGPALLEYLLEGATTARKPLALLAHLKLHLIPDLQQPFEEAISRQITLGPLPATVGVLVRDTTPELYLVAQASPSWVLGQKMLHVLASRRKDGQEISQEADNYLKLDQLTVLADAHASPELAARALADKAVKERLLVALPGQTSSPVILVEDRNALAASQVLLTRALAVSRTPDSQALALPDLKKKLERTLQYTFEITVSRQIEENTLPAGVGSLRIKKTAYLFLLDDARGKTSVNQGTAVIPPAPKPLAQPDGKMEPAQPFDQLFAEVFDRLDQQRGRVNLVSLVGLRQGLAVERTLFDRELQNLRRAGRYTLSAAEGRHGLSDEERAAAIVEGGTLLLFVSKRQG